MGIDSVGFEEPETILRLEFEDPKYNGLVVRMRTVPSGKFFDLMETAEVLSRMSEHSVTSSNLPGQFKGLFDSFSDHLVDWNLTRKGVPRPPTRESVNELELTFVMDLVLAWLGAFQDVPAPLDERSSSGETSPMPPLPMAVLSENQSS